MWKSFLFATMFNEKEICLLEFNYSWRFFPWLRHTFINTAKLNLFKNVSYINTANLNLFKNVSKIYQKKKISSILFFLGNENWKNRPNDKIKETSGVKKCTKIIHQSFVLFLFLSRLANTKQEFSKRKSSEFSLFHSSYIVTYLEIWRMIDNAQVISLHLSSLPLWMYTIFFLSLSFFFFCFSWQVWYSI